MTEPITWRSIGAPNFGNTANGMATANDMFRNAFDGIKGVIKEQEATDASNWNLGKEANTNAFLNKLMSYKTAEEAQAAQASGELGNMMSGFGAQIDGTAARTAQQSLVENLQRKEVQAQQHKDYSEEVKQRDVVAALQGAYLNATNEDEAKRVMQATGIYRDSGMLNAQGSIKLLKDGLERSTSIGDKDWKGKERSRTESNWGHEDKLHPLQIDEMLAKIASTRADVGLKGAQAKYYSEGGARAKKDAEDSANKSSNRAAIEHLIKNSVLGDGTLEGLDGRKTLRTALTDVMGLPANAVADVVENVYAQYPNGQFSSSFINKEGKTDVKSLPVPVRAVVEAVGNNPDWLGNGGLWSRRGDTARAELIKSLKKAEYVNQIEDAMYLRDRGATKAVLERLKDDSLPVSGGGSKDNKKHQK